MSATWELKHGGILAYGKISLVDFARPCDRTLAGWTDSESRDDDKPTARVLVRHDPRNLSKFYVPAPSNAEDLAIPYADLPRPPVTLSDPRRARTMLSAKVRYRPGEDLNFCKNRPSRQ